MKTIIVTDALAADLVAKNEAEYAEAASQATIVPPVYPSAPLPPVVQRSENGVRVDQPCAPGTPGTVTISATGHTLSLPMPDKENFPGYCGRVWRQANGSTNVLAGLPFMDSTFWFAPFGGYKADGSNWPQAADFVFDRSAGRTTYMTDDERAAQAGQQAAWDKTSAAQPQQPAPVVTQQPAGEVPVEVKPE